MSAAHSFGSDDKLFRLAWYHLWQWIEVVWNPAMREFSQQEHVSYHDLIITEEEFHELHRRLLTRAAAMKFSSDNMRAIARDVFIVYILEKDISGWIEELAEVLERGSRQSGQGLQHLLGIQFFYLWFCEAREISERPNLPCPDLGTLFGHDAPSVQDYLQGAHRTIRAAGVSRQPLEGGDYISANDGDPG